MTHEALAVPTISTRLASIAPKASKVSFTLYFFFLFFGTSVPFRQSPQDLSDVATSSILNQVLFSTLYLISFLCLLPHRTILAGTLRREKFLSLFLLWSFMTVFWSSFPYLSFKRWGQVVGSAAVSLAVLLNTEGEDEAVELLFAILAVYLPLSLLSVLLIPGATQWEFPAWKGFALHKNVLGQDSLAAVIICIYMSRVARSPRRRFAAALLLLISLILLAGSRSSTVYVTTFLLLSLGIVAAAERNIARPVIGKPVSVFILFLFFGGLALLVGLDPDVQSGFFRTLGKSQDFTNRVEIWTNLLDESRKHPLAGCGFDAYWVVESDTMDVLYRELQWQMNEGHNGYLDLLNETGLVGLALIGLLIAAYFFRMPRSRQRSIGMWFFLSALVINLTESTLFRLHSLNGALFLFSYISLSVTLARNGDIPPGRTGEFLA